MIFEYPLFLLIIPFYILCLYYCKNKMKSIFFPNLDILKKINNPYLNLEKIIQFLLILSLSIAISSPVKIDEINKKIVEAFEISLIVDVSGSMIKNDNFKTTKKVIMDFIEERKNDKIGLTVFANFSYIISPLTFDKNTLIEMFKKVEIGMAGINKTSLYEALFLNSKLFENSKNKNKIAILITDGKDNADSVPYNIAIEKIKNDNIKIYTIGLGKDSDNKILKEIAKETNGKFYLANKNSKITKIYRDINKLEKNKIKITSYENINYFYQYFLFLSLILSVMLLLMKERKIF